MHVRAFRQPGWSISGELPSGLDAIELPSDVTSYWGDGFPALRAEHVLVRGDPPPRHELRQVESPLTEEMLRPITTSTATIQFRSLLTDEDFERLGGWVQNQPDIRLRAYGSYDGSIVDLEFLRFFPVLRSFSVDAIWKLTSLDGLRHLPEDLDALTIGRTERSLSLGWLERLTQLRQLYLEGQTHDIEVVGRLRSLEDLTLRSITLPGLDLLTDLDHLWSLDLKLGGTKDLRELPSVGHLRYLEIWMVKGFSDLSPVSELPELEVLFLQALKNVTVLPDFARCRKLRHVGLDTMKGLRDVSPLATAPSLQSFSAVSMQHLHPEDFTCLRDITTLRQVRVGLGSDRKNRAVDDLLGEVATRAWDQELSTPTGSVRREA
jgi:hypothetical protein